MDVRFPIGQLEVPENVTKDDVAAWMEDIAAFADRFKRVVIYLDDETLEKTYREGSWNVRQLVHHIVDSQLNMYQRLKLALTDENPNVPSFNQDAWAKEPDNQLPVHCSVKMLEGMNERIVHIGKNLNSEQLKRTFTLDGTEEITVATKLAKLRWHEEHHLQHIRIALGARD